MNRSRSFYCALYIPLLESRASNRATVFQIKINSYGFRYVPTKNTNDALLRSLKSRSSLLVPSTGFAGFALIGTRGSECPRIRNRNGRSHTNDGSFFEHRFPPARDTFAPEVDSVVPSLTSTKTRCSTLLRHNFSLFRHNCSAQLFRPVAEREGESIGKNGVNLITKSTDLKGMAIAIGHNDYRRGLPSACRRGP